MPPKKIPSLTLPQARSLLIAVLNENCLTNEKAIAIVKYYTKRNFTAYLSHRKKKSLNMEAG